MYYNGFGNYYIKNGNTIKNISTNEDMTEMFGECPNIIEQAVEQQKAITEEEVIETKGSNVVKMADDKTTTKEDRWGTYDTYSNSTAKSYFEGLYMSSNEDFYINQPGDLSGVRFDVKFPKNQDNGCGLVSLVMAMQYYERNGIKKTTPSAFTNEQFLDLIGRIGTNYLPTDYEYTAYTQSGGGAKDAYIYYARKNGVTVDTGFALGDMLEYYIDLGYRGDAQTAITSTGVKNAYEKFCNTYAGGSQALSLDVNMTYNNMVGAISGGNIAIGETGIAGNAYYQNGSWYKHGLAPHHLPVYGYCTTAKGTLQDFICHYNWRNSPGMQKCYVYKTNFLNNITISVN